VIFHNLQGTLNGDPLSEYKPQRRFLYVLNLGDSTGLAVYDSLVWRGRLSWELKHRIDKRFVEEHRHRQLST
jgi:NADH dehydrogenase FAD-containing subunit